MAGDETVLVLIPTPLRRFTGGEARVSATGETIGDLLATLGQEYPGLRERICEEDGTIRRFVNVFVNGQNVRDGQGIDTLVSAGDEVGIIPAMAGGTGA